MKKQTIKTIFKVLGAIILLFALAGGLFFFIYVKPFIEKMEKTQIVNFDDRLTVIHGGGGNSGVFEGDSLVVVIDTKMEKASEELRELVSKIAEKKPLLVINTHFHPDHVGGNKLFAGSPIIAGGNYNEQIWSKETGTSEGMPTQWVKDSMVIQLGKETISIFNLPYDVHTQSDVVVYFHLRKVLFAGDIILNNTTPVIMGAGTPEGYLKALDQLNARYYLESIVPGHGSIAGIAVFDRFKQYFLDMKLAATDGEQRAALLEKYKDWTQIPFFMSPRATMRKF
ncbi:MAG: MBL fold metallo-hydrolase [bacterium]|nr:MBL fold metallo-hydrolase [bacterium]